MSGSIAPARAAGEGREFRIVLLDHMMPGVDGLALGRRISSDPRFGRALLIMLTSIGQSEETAGLADAGFAGYLVKPVVPSRLYAMIRAVLTGDSELFTDAAVPHLRERLGALDGKPVPVEVVAVLVRVEQFLREHARPLAHCHERHRHDVVLRSPAARFVHGPVAMGDCIACHDPHQSDAKFQMRKPTTSALCFSCHENNKTN